MKFRCVYVRLFGVKVDGVRVRFWKRCGAGSDVVCVTKAGRLVQNSDPDFAQMRPQDGSS
jgi:hypothetical protein